jgi:hypothetical protein
MGFDVYYLIVADLCDFARSRNIWWNVRGSGAGSLVAYCTGITGIDPQLVLPVLESQRGEGKLRVELRLRVFGEG